MSIHIFSFEEEYPSADEQLARVKAALVGLVFAGPTDIQKITNLLFSGRYDVSISLEGTKVAEIIISKTRSKYNAGSLTTSQIVKEEQLPSPTSSKLPSKCLLT